MSFVARQQQLARHLQWGPSRGPRRWAAERELRDLVRDELQRELRASPRATDTAPEEQARRQPHYYWEERDDG